MFKGSSRRPPERLPDHDLYVAGCFPCQPSSPLVSRQGAADELERGRIFEFVLAALSTKSQRAFLLEDVKGLVTQRRATLDHMLKQLRQIGNGAYQVGYNIVNATQHGIPQHRERVYIVGLLRVYIV